MIPYTLTRSRRKTMAIHLHLDGTVEVRCPTRMKKADIDAFVESKRPWIEKHLHAFQNRPPQRPLTPPEIHALAREAAGFIPQRAAHFAPKIGVTYDKISIRAQHTRWGSCSAKGNLSFNCLLLLMPPEVLDYIVVHELCHRKEMNHSPKFWAEVEKILPNYKEQKTWLKQNGPTLIARLPKKPSPSGEGGTAKP